MKNKVRSKIMRLSIALAAGAIVGAAIGILTKSWAYVPLSAWDAAAVFFLLLIWHDFHAKSPSQTATLARRDELGRSVTDVVIVAASLASLGAVVLLLVSGSSSPAHIILGLVSIVLSWATVHVVYMIRYAVMYYDGRDDGIDFSSREKPTFIDFLYVSFTIGMTYRVSDTTFTSSRFRRVAIRHALLSFLFGTAIIASSINFLASLGK